MGVEPNIEAIENLERLLSYQMPDFAHSAWSYFCELHERREYSMDGPVKFKWAEINAYQIVTETVLSSFDKSLIFVMEDEFFKNKAAKK